MGSGRTGSDRGSRCRVRNVGAWAGWHPVSGVWAARLSDGTQLWWADARSYAIRKQVARNKNLHGLAVWVLGSADPLR